MKFSTTFLFMILLTTLSCAPQSWVWQNPLPEGKFLFAVQAINKRIITAVGKEGTFLKSTNSGTEWQIIETGTDESEHLLPKQYELSRNYPNPFNPFTTINDNLSEPWNVRISVFNALGEEIRVLVNEFRTAGRHSVSFNAGALVSGIYYYTLRVSDYFSTRKMVLQK